MTRYVFDNVLPPNITLDAGSESGQQMLHRLVLKDLITVKERKVINGEPVKVVSSESYVPLENDKLNYLSTVLPQDGDNGFTACSLFAGAGGSALGLERVGYSVRACYELDKNVHMPPCLLIAHNGILPSLTSLPQILGNSTPLLMSLRAASRVSHSAMQALAQDSQTLEAHCFITI